jgi:AraC-like DNA-binding protein
MNKTVLHTPEGGSIRVSGVQEFDQALVFAPFAAKYVVRGCEEYHINNRTYKVHSGEYISGNASLTSRICIDNPQPVLGICVDIQPTIIADILQFEYAKTNAFQSFILDQEGMVQRYSKKHTHLGYAIGQIAHQFEALVLGETTLNSELFYTLGECIVKDHALLWEQFQRLNVVKHETSMRLFDFINDARNYISRHFLETISIADIAAQAHLSEYHFIRLFKKVFQLTPYQYVLELRLQYGCDLLVQGCKPVDVAIQIGFADQAAFTKAFKKKFGCTPASLK